MKASMLICSSLSEKQSIVEKIEGKDVFKYSLKRSEKVKTLSTKTSVKRTGKDNAIDSLSGKMPPGKRSPGKIPSRKLPPGNKLPQKIAPRKNALQENCPPPGKLFH